MKRTTIYVSGIALLASALFVNAAVMGNCKSKMSSNTEMASVSAAKSITGMPDDFTVAAEMTVHAVVHVKTVTKVEYRTDPIFEFFYGTPELKPQMGSGSGVIVSEDGYIVTNNHVVHGADNIEITLNDKQTYTAEVVGVDPTTDLALLKIDKKGLPYIKYGNSDSVKVGQWVLAVGNPFNLTSTVTAGIVSAKGRNINILGGGAAIESFIQTDAAVNPGNSGGALVNTKGELIGINAAIASNTGSYTGYSFAIPVGIVKKVVDDLREYGEVQRAFLGLSIKDITAELVKEKELSGIEGVYVAELSNNGAAEEAGISKGDIITKIQGVKVNSVAELQEQVGKHRPGDKVLLTVKKDGKEKEYRLTLKNSQGEFGIVKKSDNQVLSKLGAEFSPVNAAEKQKLRIQGGLKVSNIGNGIIKDAGIENGFIITKVDNKLVNKVEDLYNILKTKQGGVLFEGVYSNGVRAYYGVGIQ